MFFNSVLYTLLRRSGVDHLHGRVYVVPTGEAHLLVTVGLILGAIPRTVSARGLAVPFYLSDVRGLLSPYLHPYLLEPTQDRPTGTRLKA